jgi:hypothetical protein
MRLSLGFVIGTLASFSSQALPPNQRLPACQEPKAGSKTAIEGLMLCESATPISLRGDPAAASRAVVADVVADSRAARAGFEVGDVVRRIDGRDVITLAEAIKELARQPDLGELLINFSRDGHPYLIRLFQFRSAK